MMNDSGVLKKGNYIHLCAALDNIRRHEKKFSEVLVYKDLNGDNIISGPSLKLCEALFATLNDLGRSGIFKSPHAIYHYLGSYASKDYVEDAYLHGKGWLIERPITTARNRKYIIRKKAIES